MDRKKSFAFNEISEYREYLELKHLRSKSIIIAAVIFGMMILSITYLIIGRYALLDIIKIGLSFFGVLAINIALFAYNDKESIYLKLNKYISTLAIFSLFLALIIYLKSPSLIPFLFLAYCLCAIYQDFKVMLISNLYFIFAIIMLIINFPTLFEFKNSNLENSFGITFFSLAFLLMLSISSYIIIKEKGFFYNQIALSKEREYRSIDLLTDFKEDPIKYVQNKQTFYEKTNELLAEFSKKIDIPNIFEEKINILKDLSLDISNEEILKKYEGYTENDIERLKGLLITKNSKLFKIITKITNTDDSQIKPREIFSATHFKSFNKQSDSIETKILAFVIYYVSLKKGFTGMNSLTNDELYDTLVNTDYYYYIDSRIMKIYRENADVFNTIIEDAFGEAVKS